MNRNQKINDSIFKFVQRFAGEGLRTLALGARKIDENYYKEWRKRQQHAAVSLNDREDKLGAIYDEIECDMELVGVTAIEDKLQDGVQHAISNLQMAGIKIWVLTGDKEGMFNLGHQLNKIRIN